MFAPIPPVPLPPRRVQELLEHPELPSLFREAVRIWKALPPKGNKQVRSNEQLAKRRTQRLQRISYVRTSARAEAQSQRIQSAEEVAASARKRYNFLFTNGLNCVRLRELDDRFAELLHADEEFPPQLPDVKDLYADFYKEMTELTRTLCADHADVLVTTLAISHPYL